VSVVDSGVSEDSYYLVMELVDGVPLDVHVESKQLSPKETLRLFVTVCAAVHAAHMNGVTHRDLKPSNIRVGDDGQPHILDFGLAKMASDSGAAASQAIVTITGQFIGTVPWASPEQVDASARLIDTRTDVYSLGVILYRLLVGRFPYDVSGSMRETMEHILHTEPPRPSSLNAELNDEVDTILLKCLHKDRDRRYQSAGELARDIGRFLNGEPIEAKGDSTWYVVRKAMNRRRGLFFSLGAIFVLSVASAAGMLTLYVGQLRVARRAQEAEHRARETIEYFLTEVSDGLSRLYWGDNLRQRITESAYDRLQTLTTEDGNNPILQADIAETHSRLGGLALELGRLDEAEEQLEHARAIHEDLLTADADNPGYLSQYSINLVRLGNVAGAQGETAIEAEYYDKALAIDESLVDRFPEDQHYKDNLSWSYERLAFLCLAQKNLNQAEELIRKRHVLARELVGDDPDNPIRVLGLCSSYYLLAKLNDARGTYDGGLENAEQWVAAAKTLAALEPNNPRALHSLCFTLGYRARIYRDRNDPARAEESYARALDIADRLVQIAPTDHEFHGIRSDILTGLGRLALGGGKIDETHKLFMQSREAAGRAVLLSDGEVVLHWRRIAMACRGLAAVTGEQVDASAKETIQQQADSCCQGLLQDPKITPTGLALCAIALSYPEENLPPFAQGARLLAARAVELSGRREALPLRSLALAYNALNERKRAISLLQEALAVSVNDPVERRKITEQVDEWNAEKRSAPEG
ncbi:MAG: protein kinase, partial [Candidatus Binatia bacterium]